MLDTLSFEEFQLKIQSCTTESYFILLSSWHYYLELF